jgi:hypothetical protein
MLRVIAIAMLVLSGPVAAERTKRDAPERTTDNRDKVICKRFAETGSLVSSKRVCKSKADWERDRDNLRESTRSTSCGNVGNGGSCG